MPKDVLIRTTIPSISLIDDPSTNGFYFHSDVASEFSGIGPLFTAVEQFFNNVGGSGTSPIAYYMGNGTDRGTGHCTIEAYDLTGHLDGTPHGSPVAMDTWTLGMPQGSQSLPTGVAACVSYRADYGTDVEFGTGTRPRARDRNRHYIGPLGVHCVQDESTTGRCEFTGVFIQDCLAALWTLSGVIDPSGDNWVMQVWSRKNAGFKLPTEAWMDNRPDYQRRRSDPGTLKTFRALQSA